MDIDMEAELNPSLPPRFMRPGHAAGEFVETSKWQILREEHGLVELDIVLPERVLNPFGELFGGFTGTYVDMVSVYTARTLFLGRTNLMRTATVNMRIDYFEPVRGPRLRLRGELIKDGRSTCLVATSFISPEGTLLVYAITTMRKVVAGSGPEGNGSSNGADEGEEVKPGQK